MNETDNTTADDFAANLRALARQSRELIETLAASTRGTQLRLDGQPRPFLWGTSNARDLVALLVKLANDDTHTPTEQEPAA